MAAEASLRSQDANVDATWRQFLPHVTYDLSATWDKVRPPGAYLGLNYTSILSLNVPIFSGFSTLNLLRQAKSVRDEARATLEQTELSVIEGVMTAHAGVQTALTSLKLSDQEGEIVVEARKAIEVLEAEGSAVAFPEVFQQVRDDMMHVQRRLGVSDVGAVTQTIEQDIKIGRASCRERVYVLV